MIKVYGVSDDLIEIEGEINEEFNPKEDEVSILAFSDGTVLAIVYDKLGFWRINILIKGNSNIKLKSGTDVDEDYSDVITFFGEIEWVVYGSEFVKKDSRRDEYRATINPL